jgi:Alw26I/Eco31I/Esp3I family type II restriction m6 adenine DNA methyltransferase
MIPDVPVRSGASFRVIDPFCGDGRLVVWLIEAAVAAAPTLRRRQWDVFLWDVSPENVLHAQQAVVAAARRAGLAAVLHPRVGDSFAAAPLLRGSFDVVVTNPPWELLKPDQRDLEHLSPAQAVAYADALKAFARRLASGYPRSVPARAFSGWGINLSRVGLEVALSLLRAGGAGGVVMPGSFLADQTSVELRQWVFEQFACAAIHYYPAEARLFDGVDQTVAVLRATATDSRRPTRVVSFDPELRVRNDVRLDLRSEWVRTTGYAVSASLSAGQLVVLQALQQLPRVADQEGDEPGALWVGRELDETGMAARLAPRGPVRFLKGRHVERYRLRDGEPAVYLHTAQADALPPSVGFSRLVWRDVSRPNQKRRVQAALIPPGWVTGNSLGVLHDHRPDSEHLLWLLAAASSLPFEFQIRALLSTGHISAGAVRRATLPPPPDAATRDAVLRLVRMRTAGDERAEPALESTMARCYGLDRAAYGELLAFFPKLLRAEREELLHPRQWT